MDAVTHFNLFFLHYSLLTSYFLLFCTYFSLRCCWCVWQLLLPLFFHFFLSEIDKRLCFVLVMWPYSYDDATLYNTLRRFHYCINVYISTFDDSKMAFYSKTHYYMVYINDSNVLRPYVLSNICKLKLINKSQCEKSIESYFIWTIFLCFNIFHFSCSSWNSFRPFFSMRLSLFQSDKFSVVSETDSVFCGHNCNKYVHSDRTTNT